MRDAGLSPRGEAARRLAALNGRLLRIYSARCLRAVPLPLGPLEPLLTLNVDKEARKDALAIGHQGDLAVLLAKAREIDQEFLARLERLPLVRLRVRYAEIEPIRTQRMQKLMEVSAQLHATPWRGIRRAARGRYAPNEFEAIVREHLHLYAREVDALGRSVRLSVLFAPLRARMLQTMRAQADKLARELAELVYEVKS